MVDTNCDPDDISHLIPCNDDAIRAIRLVTSKIADAALEGIEHRAAVAAKEAEEVEAKAKLEAEPKAVAAAAEETVSEEPPPPDEEPGEPPSEVAVAEAAEATPEPEPTAEPDSK